MTRRVAAVALAVAALAACGNAEPASVEPQGDATADAADVDGDFYDQWRSELRLDEIWTGDLDGIVERGRLRVLTTYSMTSYFLVGGRPRGLVYEGVERFLVSLNAKLGLRRRPITAIYIPVSRDRLLSDLASGRGDIAAANLTITDERRSEVDFAAPFYRGIRELVVSGPGAPPLERVEDLSGVDVFVQASSSYRESVDALNRRLAAAGRAPVNVRDVDEHLESEDILELVSGGAIPVTVMDSHLAGFWAEILPDLVVHEDLALRESAEIAWALRKGTPDLRAEVDAFIRANARGSTLGNILLKRYLRDNPWVRNAGADRELARLEGMIEIFQRYADRYDFDWMLLAAQAYQESQLDQSLVSPAGAVGVMQLLPSTAASHEVGIPEVTRLEDNIHAGTKYLRVMVDRYFDDPGLDELNRHLFAFAGYNAGPNRIQRLRREAERVGLDPNEWFENVEVVVAREVGPEPVRYVSNIFKYYVAYTLDLRYYELRNRTKEEALGAVER